VIGIIMLPAFPEDIDWGLRLTYEGPAPFGNRAVNNGLRSGDDLPLFHHDFKDDIAVGQDGLSLAEKNHGRGDSDSWSISKSQKPNGSVTETCARRRIKV
jgi:hypothetical protein